MNSLEKISTKYNLNIRKYEEKNKIRIIDTDKGKFVLKRNVPSEQHLYEYLNNKHFDYLIDKEMVDNYDIFPYIDEINVPKDEKGIELVNVLSLLHNKTTFYKKVVLDDTKKLYEELNSKIDSLYHYYYDLQDIIEQKVYMAPEEYLLIRNVSLIYSALNYSKEKLEEWYKLKSKETKERVVLLHGKPSLDHFLIDNKKQLISWDKCRRDSPIYDFIYFYKSDYLELEMSSLFDFYQSKFYYNNEEYLLFLVLISLPDKIIFSGHHLKDCTQTYKLIRYVSKTRDFILKENEKYQEENKNEFEE